MEKGGATMNITKFNPFNWFHKEQGNQPENLPVRHAHAWPAGAESSPFLELHRQMDRLFDDFARRTGFGMPSIFTESPTWSTWNATPMMRPNVDIAENEKEYTIAVELPGVSEKDVNVEVVGDTLRISGEKKQESEEKNGNYHRIQRSFGAFQRILDLPQDANTEGVEAKFRNGVMTISIPRKEGVQVTPKRVEVTAA